MEVITTQSRLRELYRRANHRVLDKDTDRIDDIIGGFIALSPFVLISTHNRNGGMDISPKGDPPGFVTVLDEKTLAIPDRPGNNRLDTFENLLVNPEIGLLFLIPGNGDTLRIRGTAQMVRDDALLERLGVDGKPALLALIVTVTAAFMHCPKCVIRSKLWQPQQWPDRERAPTLAEQMVTHGGLDETVLQMQALIDVNNEKLY
jgi:PPOX class probable FMN-dependent enzyme